jgi:CRP/FNR family cyclic AMP-dependent transcriptional regulator
MENVVRRTGSIAGIETADPRFDIPKSLHELIQARRCISKRRLTKHDGPFSIEAVGRVRWLKRSDELDGAPMAFRAQLSGSSALQAASLQIVPIASQARVPRGQNNLPRRGQIRLTQINYVRHRTLYLRLCGPEIPLQGRGRPGRRALPETARSEFDPQTFLGMVGEGRTVSTFHKNETVFAQGEKADKVFYIQKGTVKVVVLSEQGKEAVVGILESGQFFGEGCLNGQPLRISTTTAMEDCVITAITKTAMLAALHGEPRFSELFMSYLLMRNSRIEADLVDQLFNSSEKRLARLLLLLANFGKDGSPQPVKVYVSQETLAEMIGTTRSRVSFFMNRFRKLGFISYNGEIEIHNSLLNAVLHDTPQIRRH